MSYYSLTRRKVVSLRTLSDDHGFQFRDWQNASDCIITVSAAHPFVSQVVAIDSDTVHLDVYTNHVH